MTPRSRPRLVAAVAAAGTAVLSLAGGGVASADVLDAQPDTNAPTVIVELPPASERGWYTDDVDIALYAADIEGAIASINWSVDGGPVTTVPGNSATATISSGGEHFFEVYAIDAAGNRSGVITRDVNVDLAAPWVASFSLPQDTMFDIGEQALLGFICSDDLSGVDECSTDDLNDGYLDTSAVGPHEVQVLSRDVAGNEQITPYRYTVAGGDTTAPTVTATVTGTHVNDEWFTGDTTVTIAVADPTELDGAIEYSFDGQWTTVFAGVATITVPDDGVHDVSFTARDAAGNTSEMQSMTVRRDTVAPQITVSAGADLPLFAPDALPNGAIVEQGSEIAFNYACTDVTSGIGDCDGDIPSGDLLSTEDLGYHEVLVTATDAAGNESSSIFEYTVEEAQGPTDPGTGGPSDPGTGGPAGPAPQSGAGAPTGQADVPRSAADAVNAGLAETGGAIAPWAIGLAAALLLGGVGAMRAAAVRRRS